MEQRTGGAIEGGSEHGIVGFDDHELTGVEQEQRGDGVMKVQRGPYGVGWAVEESKSVRPVVERERTMDSRMVEPAVVAVQTRVHSPRPPLGWQRQGHCLA